MIYYIYDASDNVIGLKYNDDIYYYEKNIQNDITGIMDDSFNLLATYEYDSWGNILSIKDTNGNTITDSTNIAIVNPFRYRSYYYDSEIGMYYLNSRYYNQEWGRFINADGIIGANQDTIGNNLYAYCSNNPINNSDLSGAFSIKSILKNTAKAISTGISKVCKVVINTGKSIGKAIVNNFSAEVGVGTGAGASVSPLGIQTRITTYKDKTWGIANGKACTSITGNASA